MGARVDLTGRRFGRLIASKRLPVENKTTFWECVCDCKNIVKISYSNLSSGATKSCGCIKSEQNTALGLAKSGNLAGKQYGDWLVLERRGVAATVRQWLCRCKCGEEKEVSQTHLKKGNSTCCVKCAAQKISDRSKDKRLSPNGRWLRGKNGLQEKYWSALRREQFIAQNGICPLCNKPLPEESSKWAWDHNHITDECRALLHLGCNVFLGRIENDPELIKRTQKYLEDYA